MDELSPLRDDVRVRAMRSSGALAPSLYIITPYFFARARQPSWSSQLSEAVQAAVVSTEDDPAIRDCR